MSNNQQNTTPWTRGPWTTTGYNSGWGGHAVIGPDRDGEQFPVGKVNGWGEHPEADANAALIALAPEMAEAILALADQHHRYHASLSPDMETCPAKICSCATRLRAFNADQETTR